MSRSANSSRIISNFSGNVDMDIRGVYDEAGYSAEGFEVETPNHLALFTSRETLADPEFFVARRSCSQ
ncbi:hypothetical protein M407DRAFT_29715 [Tulasnella calospora MUT 4182]|uniref:Uncharacterized protein n=1 Tax=Tulasnella calospora MUT 4182 TaxID=1051891 RepID=A0A0C3KGN1_9AGAM|nr:hypothetical protein M407DRAFT_29715 [Tulasnella calospora MUT 4182]